MQIPRHSAKSKPTYHKQCKEPGCKEMFYGIGVTKYCEKHRDPKNRYKAKEVVSNHNKNIYITHKFTDDVLVEVSCKFCGVPYRIKLEPKLYIYSGCCDKCRSKPQGEGNE